MRLLILKIVCLLPLASPLSAAPGIAPTEALAPRDQQKKFHLPPGFEIQLVVSEPDIGQPMNLNFDARGRLWITHSIEYPYPAKGDFEPRVRFPGSGDHDPRDRITVVESIAKDGGATKITHFANALNIPIGHTPLGDGNEALVYSLPNIYRIADTTGDGQADQRDVLYGRFGNIDTHGMVSSLTRWVDGWVYGCHGFSNTSEVRDAGGHVTKMNSGNTYRLKEDGSRFEQFTWGQVNPFGMTFDPWGNLYDADCHSMPVYMLLRGAYYPSFGKPHDGLGFGPTMIDHGHGSTGICGPVYYAADHFPGRYRDSMFICNPVNCVVHHDQLKQVGSTRLVETQPDFITCDDGWFRPVDLALGPDGSLYIADFYNCIIGHYEVPLDHPRRDRNHGRVWRVVYKGTDGESRVPRSMPDLTKLDPEALVALLADANLQVRTLATNRLVDIATDRGGRNWARASVLAAVSAAANTAKHTAEYSPLQQAHLLWVIERTGGLERDQIRELADDPSALVRTHLYRALAERKEWQAAEFHLVRSALHDKDATVRRVAADALGRHPHRDNVWPLLELWKSADPKDTHLVHVARMAVRDQMRDSATLSAIREMPPDAPTWKTLAELAVSLKTPAAANFVVDYLDRHAEQEPRFPEFVEFAGQYLQDDRIDVLIRVIRNHLSDDLDFQFQQLLSIQAGLERRGVADNPSALAWADELTTKLLDTGRKESVGWQSIPHDASVVKGDPWVRQQRASADGDQNAEFWSSLPRGERLMGVLRSGAFKIPPRLDFYAAGHNGPTNQVEMPRNFIRLRDAATGSILAEAKPPRHDIAQRVQWDLSDHAGRRGFIELVDGFDATGYAWLAVGRFSLAALNNGHVDFTNSALRLISRFGLREFRPRVEAMARSADEDLVDRISALRTLQSFAPDARIRVLIESAEDRFTRFNDDEFFDGLVEQDDRRVFDMLTEVMQAAPRAVQHRYAGILASDRSGGEALLRLVAAGRASPRLLLDKNITARLLASKVKNAESRIAEWTAELPSEHAGLRELVARRVKSFKAATASARTGGKVFEKRCAACHQIAGKGAKIGPQLDGIGARGLERLAEDILDPNRNVDPTFRTTTLLLDDGRVVSGLIRRTEGETVVLADAQGKEFTVTKASIEDESRGSLSLMAANFGETMPESEFHALMAYLLTQKKTE